MTATAHKLAPSTQTARPAKILIADDDPANRLLLVQTFTGLGYQVRATNSAATLRKWLADSEADLALVDLTIRDEDVLQVLRHIRKDWPQLPIIAMSAQNTLQTAVCAVELGAFDYASKPFQVATVVASARRALARTVDAEATRGQARAIRDDRLPMIGRSDPMQAVYRQMARLVGSDLTVLVLGESGTGKALVARALHDLGRRRDRSFVGINVAALAQDSVERELFGAGDDQPGRLMEADGGSLFLDSIGDMTLQAQARLLRVLDGGEPILNPRTGRPPNVRIITATHHDLSTLVQQGLFREDLFFRLNVAPLRIPPLRDRPQDIPDLARAFLLRAQREGLAAKTIDIGALARLQAHPWPGNVRELENLIRRICALYAEDLITLRIVSRELADQAPATDDQQQAASSLSHLVERRLSAFFADQPDGGLPSGLYAQVMRKVELPLIKITLAATRGNQVQAAEVLGMNRNTLRRKMQEYGIELKRGVVGVSLEGLSPAGRKTTADGLAVL